MMYTLRKGEYRIVGSILNRKPTGFSGVEVATLRIARFRILITAFFLTVPAGILSLPSPAGELLAKVRYRWPESSRGTPVVHYVMEIEQSLGGRIEGVRLVEPIPGPEHEIEVEYGYEYRVRVAGVDAQDVRGPWSIWSVILAPEAVPGG